MRIILAMSTLVSVAAQQDSEKQRVLMAHHSYYLSLGEFYFSILTLLYSNSGEAVKALPILLLLPSWGSMHTDEWPCCTCILASSMFTDMLRVGYSPERTSRLSQSTITLSSAAHSGYLKECHVAWKCRNYFFMKTGWCL